ncbi:MULTISPECIES: MarC family NAAT transporter [unclassified Flavobacterium]|uniref:MarC family NAAT transporter n=1 Tax=unclassified Flavobacterium TaxID=196869 RepID=UPI00096887BD|nr:MULTISPECIES: MarC family NAAT transporter [unclassified Flavobacterium]MBN9285042.1 MarC family NAAT transporter [Flavobacterium sp.]OJV69850.1 MAG: antibiotic resistance protein MarC [Flavobacterium sp. 40-81]
MELFIYIFAAVFSVLNPLGAVPIFVGLTHNDTKAERSRTSLWTAVNVFIILIISFFIGEYVLKFFGISIDALRIAGGLIIVNSGFALLSGKFSKTRGVNKKVANDAQKRSDIALTPLAIPMLAGPGSISLLIAFYQDFQEVYEKAIVCSAILAVALSIFIILRSAHYLSRILGASGIVAISRIIGFIVIAIGIQYISSSIVNILKTVAS